MIRTWSGDTGSGKTFGAMKLEIIPALLRGVDVFINFTVTQDFINFLYSHIGKSKKLGRLYYFHSFDQLKYVRGGLVVIDEGQDYLDAQKWDLLPPWFKVRLSQNRKILEYDENKKAIPLDILLLTQDLYRVDINYRRYSYDVVRIYNLGFGCSLAVSFNFHESARDSKERWRLKGFKLFYRNKKIFRFYNSFEMVQSLKDMADFSHANYNEIFIEKFNPEIDIDLSLGKL